MCPKCWKTLSLCDGCLHEATRHPSVLYVTTQKWEGDLLAKLELGSTGNLLSSGDDGGCSGWRLVTSSS